MRRSKLDQQTLQSHYGTHTLDASRFAERGYSITVLENEEVCLDCSIGSPDFSKCHIDIWYKLDCVATSQPDGYIIFMRNMQLNPAVISNELAFAFNESDGRLYITNVSYIHRGLYLRKNVCEEKKVFVFIRFKGMPF